MTIAYRIGICDIRHPELSHAHGIILSSRRFKSQAAASTRPTRQMLGDAHRSTDLTRKGRRTLRWFTAAAAAAARQPLLLTRGRSKCLFLVARQKLCLAIQAMGHELRLWSVSVSVSSFVSSLRSSRASMAVVMFSRVSGVDMVAGVQVDEQL